MTKTKLLAVAGAATLGLCALSATPASAQFYFGVNPPPPAYYPPPPPAYGPPPGYGYGYYRGPRRCWNRPVQVWNGWRYVTRMQRVCR